MNGEYVIETKKEVILCFGQEDFEEWISGLCSEVPVQPEMTKADYMLACLEEIQMTGEIDVWVYFDNFLPESQDMIKEGIEEYIEKNNMFRS